MTSKKEGAKGRYNFLLDQKIYSDFSKICEEQGYVRSKKIEHFIRDFILKAKEGKHNAGN